MGALGAATSGLDAANTALTQVSQNLANANTVGYKSSTDVFQQMMETTMSSGTAPTKATGGQNPIQVPGGGAVALSTVQTQFGQGGLRATGIASNLALSGTGWFVVQTPKGPRYTRNGAFNLDAAGTLTDAQGNAVQGWTPQIVAGGSQNASNLSALKIQVGQAATPTASTQATLKGNLDASATGTSAASTTSISVPVTFYDAQGAAINANLVFSNPTATTGGGGGVQWTAKLYPSGSTTPYSGTAGTIVFSDTAGTAPTWSAAPSWTITPTDGSPSMTIALSNTDIANMTSNAAATTATAMADGAPAGSLTQYTIGSDGIITGTFSNGTKATLGQVAVANFPNQSGLLMVGNNNWEPGPNAGSPSIGVAGQGGRGSIVSGDLEESNVSLSDQFTQLIKAQEDFGANAKVLTVSQTDNNALVNAVQ